LHRLEQRRDALIDHGFRANQDLATILGIALPPSKPRALEAIDDAGDCPSRFESSVAQRVWKPRLVATRGVDAVAGKVTSSRAQRSDLVQIASSLRSSQ
jgi:hypothetical protein